MRKARLRATRKAQRARATRKGPQVRQLCGSSCWLMRMPIWEVSVAGSFLKLICGNYPYSQYGKKTNRYTGIRDSGVLVRKIPIYPHQVWSCFGQVTRLLPPTSPPLPRRRKPPRRRTRFRRQPRTRPSHSSEKISSDFFLQFQVFPTRIGALWSMLSILMNCSRKSYFQSFVDLRSFVMRSQQRVRRQRRRPAGTSVLRRSRGRWLCSRTSSSTTAAGRATIMTSAIVVLLTLLAHVRERSPGLVFGAEASANLSNPCVGLCRSRFRAGS